MIGKRILSYEVKYLLGEGGMGNVYLAVHVTSGEKVAIKSLLPQLVRHEQIKERFKKEADTMSLLPHPNIVRLIGYKEDSEGAYIIMEYVEGKELGKYIITESGPMPKDLLLPIMQQILDAFSFAHKHGVVHRDIKPSNILLTNDRQVKIMDFGIAKLISEADKKLTKTGLQMGTVFYMSPEQVKGKAVDKRSDIYSLGVTLFQMVTGESPYESIHTDYEVYNKIVNEPLPSVKSIYPGAMEGFDNIIAKATAKDPNNRFEDCAQFSEELLRVSKNAPGFDRTTVPKPTNSVEVKKTSSFGWKGAFLIAIGCLIILFVIGSMSSKSADDTTDTVSSDSTVTRIDSSTTVAPPVDTSTMAMDTAATPRPHTDAVPSGNTDVQNTVRRVYDKVFYAGLSTEYIYSGEVKDGFPHGYGKQEGTNNDGTKYVYEGYFKDGLRDGTGTLKWSKGDKKFEGTFKDDYYIDGTYYSANGDLKIGNFTPDSHHYQTGFGTYVWNNGTKYVGYFVDGNFSGKGSMYDANGNKFQSGTYANDKLVEEDKIEGSAMVWIRTNFKCGSITVTIDEKTRTIRSYYDSPPDCGADGTATFALAPGTYDFSASCEGYTWKGSVIVTADKCVKQELVLK